jgi:anthranilate phosphoribosyltransferase
MLQAYDFGLEPLKQNEIHGGYSIPSSAKIFMHILKGQGTDAQNNVVCANAGLAIAAVENTDPKTGFEKAMDSLKSGKALKSFETLIDLSKN